MKMTYGLLWYDANAKRPVRDKILDAARRYREKFGQDPNICFVHPDDVPPEAPLMTLPKRLVRRDHFLVGIDEDAPRADPPRSNGRNETRGVRSRPKRSSVN